MFRFLAVSAFVGLLSSALAVSFAVAQTAPSRPGTITLDDVLERVERDNHELHAAWLEADVLATRRGQIAWPDPMVGVMYQPISAARGSGLGTLQWRVDQMIPYPDKLALQREIADLGASVAVHEADVMRAELFLEAKRAYFKLYRVQQVEDILTDFRERLAGYEQVATARYEVGAGMQMAVLKAQLEKNELSQRLIDLRRERSEMALMLARLTNMPGGAAYFTSVRVAEPSLAVRDLAALQGVAERYRPELAALAAAARRADRNVELMRKEFRPDFGVMAERPMTPMGDEYGYVALGVNVRLPVQRGRLRAQLQEAQLEREMVEAHIEHTLTRVQTEVEDLLFALQQEAQSLDLFRTTLIPQAQTTVSSTVAAYSAGTADFLDLLDSERMQLSLRLEFEETRMRYLHAAAGLERALGVTLLEDVERLMAAKEEQGTPTTNDPSATVRMP